MKNKTKFNVNETVVVKGVKGVIMEIDTTLLQAEEIDYLIRPIDEKEMILGQCELGAGWVMESNIEKEPQDEK